MVRFSIVLPLLGPADRFEHTLASVLRYRPDSAQVIVVHDDSYSDPHGLSGEVEFVSTKRKPHLIRLFNYGLRVARGNYIALIRPGIELNEGWNEVVESAFADPDVGSVSPAIVASSSTSRLLTAGIASNYKYDRKLVGVNKRLNSRRASRCQPLGPSTWAAFYRRSLLTSLGNCDEQLDPHYLDLDLALSLNNLRFGCQFVPDCIVTLDDPQSLTEEFRLPHGQSAQRSLNRQIDLSGSSQLAKTFLAAIAELSSTPWRPSNAKHLLQRFGAIPMRKIDRHHWNLLSVLKKQRMRLVEANLPLRETTMPKLAPASLRNAA